MAEGEAWPKSGYISTMADGLKLTLRLLPKGETEGHCASHAGILFKDIEKAAKFKTLDTRQVGPVLTKYKPLSEAAKEKLKRLKKTAHAATPAALCPMDSDR